jgi:high affinity Mn2+ porin
MAVIRNAPILTTLGLLLSAAPCLAAEGDPWSFHGQATVLPQGHGDFHAVSSGNESLSRASELDTSYTATLFLGRRLWPGGEVYFDPELTGGSGLSATHGVADFPNGEIFRVDDPSPKANLARLFVRHTVGLGGDTEAIEEDKNQLAQRADVSRLTVTAGKFSLNDILDDNTYSHDPRTQFMGWSFMDSGWWDYAADTRGYTWALAVELNQPRWAIRAAVAMMPALANGMQYDTDLSRAHGDNLELEYRYRVGGRPGKLRLLGFVNHAHMGNYRTTLDTPGLGMDITLTRQYSTKYGGGVNFEQELTDGVGIFGRAGLNDGRTETFAFTEIDRSVSLGVSVQGRAWKRPEDCFGVGIVVNGLSAEHAAYLTAGGYGFLIGDGNLNYGPEQVIEGYYLYKAAPGLGLTADFQQILNPAYNQDRGPVTVFAARLHYEI